MKRQFYAALLLLFAPFSALHAAEPDALAAIDACISRLDAQLDIGYGRIATRCPDLTQTLERTGWAAWLPQGWKEPRNDLSAGSLRELRSLVARELATRPAARTPRVERLGAVLTDLGKAGQQSSGAWARFKKWVRSLFERGAQKRGGSWLDQMVSRTGVANTVIEIITYIALAAVVGLAGFIVVNELRLAGVLGRRRVGGGAANVQGAGNWRARPTWADVERAPLLHQPRLLLEVIVGKLTDLRRLPPAGAFTARELVRAADLQEPADRERLTALAMTAERVTYADETVPPAAVQSAVSSARELLVQLESRP